MSSVTKIFSNSQLAILCGVLLILTATAFIAAYYDTAPSAVYLSFLFAIPTIWAASRWIGKRDAAIVFALLGILGLAVETFLLIGGGASPDWAPMPRILTWVLLAIGCYTAAALTIGSTFARVFVGSIFLIVVALITDAVFKGYGSELSTQTLIITDVAVSFAGIGLLEIIAARLRPLLPVPVQLLSGGWLLMFVTTAVAAFSGVVLAAIAGAVFVAVLTALYARYHYRFDEMIVFVDEENNPIGTSAKLAAHDGATRLHRAFSVFLFDRNGKLLLQQRAFGKKTWPGIWSNSCCGHVMLHETVESAAKRRLRYELGLRNIQLYSVLPDFRYQAEMNGIVENEICPVFIGFTDAPPKLNADEVNDIQWIDWNGFREEVSQISNEYSPWAVEEAIQLAQSIEFIRLLEDNTYDSKQKVSPGAMERFDAGRKAA